jgi:putative CocE/NonD family hydrolase
MRMVVDKNVRVRARDGVTLATDVYLPDRREPCAALVQRVPYGRDVARIVDFSLSVHKAVEAGYAAVVQDVRGRGGSDGLFRPFLDDGSDGADTIAWVKAQEWSDGRVGMFGGSYGGASQWAAARAAGAEIGAIAPFVATPDCYDGWIHRRGVFELGFNLHWTLRNIAPAEAARRTPSALDPLLDANDATDDMYAALPVADQPVLDGVADYYASWAREPEPTGAWGALASTDAVDVPVLSIGGWFDVFQRGSLTGYRLSPAGRRRLVMGPWAHSVFGGWYRDARYGIRSDAAVVDLTKVHLRWFDRWLRGIDNGAEQDAPVRVFVLGSHTWSDEADWPPPDVVPTALYLRSGGRANTSAGDGRLSQDAPQSEPDDSYRYDPNDPVPTCGGATFLPGLALAANSGPRDQSAVERRADVLSYTTDPLEHDLLAIGPVEAFVHLSCSAPDTDVALTLTDVTPQGRSINVADGIARARYRDSRLEPSLLVPGTPYELRVDLGGMACLFRRGHRIRVTITGGSFPRFERNPQTGEAPALATELAPATTTIHHSATRPSHVLLPIVERAA